MKSIRRQLTRTFLAGFGLVLLCGGLAVYFLLRLALLEAFDSSLRAKAAALIAMADDDEHGFHIENSDTFWLPEERNLHVYYEVWRTNGVRCALSGNLETDLPLPKEYSFWNLELPGDIDGRAIGLPFILKKDDEDSPKSSSEQFIAVVAEDRLEIDSTLSILATVLIGTGLVGLVFTVILVNSALRRGHAPLERLAVQASLINADSLRVRFPVDSLPIELQPIARRLNDLLARLESSFERERRFSADLAHELRTPISELRSLAEVELAWPEGGETEKYRDVLNVALRMETLVVRLLELARSEHGAAPVRLEPVRLEPLVADVWRPFAGRAAERRLAVEMSVPADAVLDTDPVLFRSILANLFANAVEYSPAGGRCAIRWDAARRELTAGNTVQDLNSADIPHLFERLWRKDPSRAGGEHCGLGLALSRVLAARLGLELSAHLDATSFLAMTLRPRGGG